MSTAFALRAEYEGTVTDEELGERPRFIGAVLSYADGRAFNVRDELDRTDGVIVVDDANVELVQKLDALPALKRVSVPDNAEPISGRDADTVPDLRDELTRRGIVGAGRATKPALIAALDELDRRVAAGESVRDGQHIDSLTTASAGDAGEED